MVLDGRSISTLNRDVANDKDYTKKLLHNLNTGIKQQLRKAKMHSMQASDEKLDMKR